MRSITIDSIEVEIKDNRRVMRGLPPSSSVHKRLVNRNMVLGAMAAAIKRGEDPLEVERAAVDDLKAKGIWVG